MKYVAAALVILFAVAGIYARSLLWGIDHTPIGPSSISSNGLYVGRFYSMPESSEVPYGLGVLVNLRFVPAWIQSDLVFAAYCKNGERLTWREPKDLVISCEVETGKPHFYSAPHGIKVTHAGSS